MERRYVVGIGPGKSGSTWLYTFLRSSREVCCSNVKETDYFLSKSVPNETEYLQRFFPSRQQQRIFCEVSNTYLYHPDFTARAAALGCKIEFITILRDPIDRAVSHVAHLMRNGKKFNCFADALYESPDILTRGLYASYLKNFHNLPPNLNLHLLSFDDLARDEAVFQQSLLARLGMNADMLTDDRSRRFPRAVARNKYIARLTKTMARQVRRAGLGSVVQTIKDGPVPSILYKQGGIETDLSVEPSVLHFMRDFYSEADRKLQLEWGIDTSGWQSQSNV